MKLGGSIGPDNHRTPGSALQRVTAQDRPIFHHGAEGIVNPESGSLESPTDVDGASTRATAGIHQGRRKQIYFFAKQLDGHGPGGSRAMADRRDCPSDIGHPVDRVDQQRPPVGGMVHLHQGTGPDFCRSAAFDHHQAAFASFPGGFQGAVNRDRSGAATVDLDRTAIDGAAGAESGPAADGHALIAAHRDRSPVFQGADGRDIPRHTGGLGGIEAHHAALSAIGEDGGSFRRVEGGAIDEDLAPVAGAAGRTQRGPGGNVGRPGESGRADLECATAGRTISRNRGTSGHIDIHCLHVDHATFP